MLLERFYDDGLAQASYLIGCQATGEAIVVDPNRDVAQYLEKAAAERLRITHVAETHIHADFLSGARALAEAAGAALLLSDEGGDGWRYAFPTSARVIPVRDGDSIRIGNLRLQAVHTPGHTPEHVVFFVTDGAASDRPMGIISGDFIFAGDVGRPDLLERAAGVGGTMESMARVLFQSLRRMEQYPDYLQIWPGHGAGSACGKALGAVPSTTLGYERIANWAFQIGDEAEFVRAVLSGQPEPPRYFADMKRINRDNQPGTLPGVALARMGLADLERFLAEGVWILDLRPTAEFAKSHVPGTINIPFGRSFGTYAGTVVPIDQPVGLIVAGESSQPAAEAQRALAMIGFDGVLAWGGSDLLDAWRESGRALGSTPQVEAAALAQDGRLLLDVRGKWEWEAGHAPGVKHVYYGELLDRLDEIPRDRPIAVQCQTGSRSAIAASLLRARGFGDVVNARGGFAAWKRAGLPVEIAETHAHTGAAESA